MESWIDDLARALGEEALTADEVETLLGVARDVAHGVERKITPLSTFLLGAAVGRRQGGGEDRSHALDAALAALRGTMPEAPAE
jgi:hypothetical protein